MSKTVVVVGGGYGGSLVAKSLDNVADVVLVDARDAFVNNAAMLRGLTQPDWAPNVFFPFSSLLERGRFIRGTVRSVDPHGVTLTSGDRVAADYIVLATGSDYPFPGKPRPDATSTADALNELRQANAELVRANHVLILGAGAVGIELSGEIKEVWPEKRVTVVDPSDVLLPDFLPEMREDLQRQLQTLGVELRLGAGLTALPTTGEGTWARFSVQTTRGEEIEADIWFRAFGVHINSGYLRDGKLVKLTDGVLVPVAETMNVNGYSHVYALGDIVDHADPKMASYAQTQAEVVVENIRKQVAGETPDARYVATPDRRILIPLGTRGGVGQLPTPQGPVAVGADVAAQRKGADLFTSRFAQRFGGVELAHAK